MKFRAVINPILGIATEALYAFFIILAAFIICVIFSIH